MTELESLDIKINLLLLLKRKTWFVKVIKPFMTFTYFWRRLKFDTPSLDLIP